MRFSVGIVKYGVDPNARCFEDFAHAVARVLRALGHDTRTDWTGRLIMFGANNMLDSVGTLPSDAISYNAEQIAAVKLSRLFVNVEQYKDRFVWDYSEANAAKLRDLGFKRVVMCPVGYEPKMTSIAPVDEDIDVLFYGSLNPRRKEILNRLAAAGLRVLRLFNIYGAERDAVIARAKVVLNMHHYERGVFEIFRVSHLLANRKCVVSEGDGCDAGLEAFAERATRLVSYDRLAEACRELVGDAGARVSLAERGHAEFTKIDLVENVRVALEASK